MQPHTGKLKQMQQPALPTVKTRRPVDLASLRLTRLLRQRLLEQGPDLS